MKGDQTLQKGHRILRSRDFQRVWREGQRFHTTHFVILVNPGGDRSRLGITVGRKVGNAVCRNRLKRWIRELFRLNLGQFIHRSDVSIIAKRHAGQLSHPQLDEEILDVFVRLGTENHD